MLTEMVQLELHNILHDKSIRLLSMRVGNMTMLNGPFGVIMFNCVQLFPFIFLLIFDRVYLHNKNQYKCEREEAFDSIREIHFSFGFCYTNEKMIRTHTDADTRNVNANGFAMDSHLAKNKHFK